MVATQIVILLVWVQLPVATPKKIAALADVVIAGDWRSSESSSILLGSTKNIPD